MNIMQQKELAMKILKISKEEVETCSGFVEEIGTLFVTIPNKDGVSLLIGNDGTILLGNSSYSFSVMLEDFKNGKRTPLKLLNL